MVKTGLIIEAMCEYFSGDIRRINHFLKVYSFAKAIAECENVDDKTLKIIEAAAVTHDIGIKLSEQKYGSSAGKYQEKEGPAEAKKLLGKLGEDDAVTKRVCWLIAHHHTYSNIDSIDYRILVEADFLVNMYEDSLDEKAVCAAKKRIFKTEAGIRMLESLYLSHNM